MQNIYHFENDEQGYMAWLASCPQGFVLNVRHPPEKDRLMLHRATCGSISGSSPSRGLAPFTAGLYTKVCSERHELIAEWVRKNVKGAQGYKLLCKLCKPDAPMCSVDEAAELQSSLTYRAEKALHDSVEIRRARLAKANPRPVARFVTTWVFERNPDVVAEVLYRAGGRCEGCQEPAPFNSKATGKPYLEVHHVIQLANDGEDTVENAVALCPNCHRERHFG